MLSELNVRDIALIHEAGVEFGKSLNILTGETGAGKSVIIGSALLSLGGKARTDMIRDGASGAYTELVFSVDSAAKRKRIAETGVEVPEDGTLVFSRKLSDGRSVSRINGETVSLSLLKSAASELIDIYGQNEYHTLMDNSKHLEILDAFLGTKAQKERAGVHAAYITYRNKKEKLESFDLEESERLRELSLAEYEIAEIDEANLKEGEEEELSALYKRLNNGRNLEECLGRAAGALSEIPLTDVIASVTEALRYDENLNGIRSELLDAQAILSDAESGIDRYLSGLDLSAETLAETEARLDLIRGLEARYGRDVEAIRRYREERELRRQELENYEAEKQKAGREKEESFEALCKAASELTILRKKAAEEFCGLVRGELLELGFDSVRFEVLFSEKEPCGDGADSVCFNVALNPGEQLRPLGQVASGGELSRVMLSIKTVLARTDDIPTLIFDEIDSGISGRTAQKVAEKLDLIARNHQVICITHLPQIAAMADTHFVIRKEEVSGRNVTTIEKLSEKESEEELARLLGGAKVTDAVRSNAAEMKKFASEIKKEHLKY